MRSAMRTWGRGVMAAVVAAAVGCAPRSDRHAGSPLEQGRIYTAWLYQSQYQKLWDRFSPEMRQTFGSVADLASFAGRSVQQLGAERGAVDERRGGKNTRSGSTPGRHHSSAPAIRC